MKMKPEILNEWKKELKETPKDKWTEDVWQLSPALASEVLDYIEELEDNQCEGFDPGSCAEGHEPERNEGHD